MVFLFLDQNIVPQAGKAKMAIWLTRKNKTLLNGGTDPLYMFKALVKSRLILEYKFYEFVKDTESFFSLWGTKGILCQPNEERGYDIML